MPKNRNFTQKIGNSHLSKYHVHDVYRFRFLHPTFIYCSVAVLEFGHGPFHAFELFLIDFVKLFEQNRFIMVASEL